MPTISDEERILLFLESFHFLSKKSFWPKLRQNGRVDLLSTMQFTVDETGTVYFRALPLSDEQESLAAAYFRKYISGGDQVYLGSVLEAVCNLGLTGSHIPEARSQFSQVTDRKWPFRVKDGNSVGAIIANVPIVWGSDKNLRLAECDEFYVSLKDVTEVTFNEGMLHAFAPGRNEEVRAVVRTISEPLRKAMSNIALAATVYITMILHGELMDARPEWSCDYDACPEKQILERFAAHQGQRESVELNSFGVPRADGPKHNEGPH